MEQLAIVASGGAGLNVISAGQPPQGVPVLCIGIDEAHAVRVRKERGLAVHLSSPGELDGWEHLEPSIASHFIGTLSPGVRGAFTRRVVLHVTGLGGRTGTSVSKALCRIRGGLSKATLHLAILPFSMEGQRHARALEDAALIGATSTVVRFPNDLVARDSPDRPFQESMHVANLLVLEVARALAALPGEAVEKIARSGGGYRPVLGAGPKFSAELRGGLGGSAAADGYLIAAPGSGALPGIEDEMAAAGITVASQESSGIAADHWLLLLRQSR